MKKEFDFSKGKRGKYADLDLKVLGAAETVWAVCLAKDSDDLIPFKLYRIDVFSNSDEIRSNNEKGKTAYYPKVWFAPVEVPKKTLGLLELAS